MSSKHDRGKQQTGPRLSDKIETSRIHMDDKIVNVNRILRVTIIVNP
jgi:hypothetical protein